METPESQTRDKFSPPSTPCLIKQPQPLDQQQQLPTPTTPSTATFPNFVTTTKTSPNTKRNLQDEFMILQMLLPPGIVSVSPEILGQGSNSRVHGCRLLLSNGETISNKVVKMALNKNKNKIMKKEAIILKLIHDDDNYANNNSNCIIGFYGAMWLNELGDNARFGILLERMDVDLETYIGTLIPSSSEVLPIGKENWYNLYHTLIKSLKILKNLKIVHCDLKTSNILYNPIDQIFKICDFSSLRFVSERDEEDDDNHYFSQLETTLQFMAPELLQLLPNKKKNSQHTYHTDLYSAGLILLHTATGKQPYDGFCSGNNSAHLVQLMNLIKKNAVLRVLSDDSMDLMRLNCDVWELLDKILMTRCDLEQLVV